MDDNFDKPVVQEPIVQDVSSAKDYAPIDILELGYDPNYLQTVDEEYLDMVITIAPYMPSKNYNPAGVDQVAKPQFDPNSWFSANTVFEKPTQRNVKPTKSFSIRDTNFDRYYNHPKFSTLGFNPYRDNETYYNENSSWSDDWSRAMGQFGANFTPGFTFFGVRGNEGIFNFFDTDPDTEDAVKMAEAMRIGNSSKEGFGASFTNFTLNSAYSVSIMASIAAEELAMWAATAALAAATPLTFGVSGGAAVATGTAAAAKTVTNAAKFGKALGRLGDATAIGRAMKGGRSIVGALKNIDNSRDFWSAAKTGESTLGRIFLPETMQALRTFEATKDVGTGIVKLGRGASAFGGFYRDIRMIDLALDESRLESGFVYNDMISNGIAAKQLELGSDNLSEKDLKDIQEAAVTASTKTLALNAPVIYLSNRITIGGVISPFSRGVRKIFDESTGKLGKKIIQTKKGVVDGKTTKNVFEKKKSIFSSEGRRQRKSAYSFGDYVTRGAHGALRYFAANVSEGVQELYQEALQVGVVDYHIELLNDPAVNKKLLYDLSLSKAIDSQMSAQGFETFMSGFATGGILGVGSKIIYSTVPDTYNRVFNSKEFAKQKADRETAIDELVNLANEQWNKTAEKGQSMLDTTNLNFVKAKQAAEEQGSAAYSGDRLDFKDNQDFLEFNQLASVISNGMIDSFRQQLKDIMQLSDAELAQAYPDQAKDAKAGKTRKRLQDFLNKSYELEDNYNAEADKNPNPFDVKQFKQGSREYREELYKYTAWEHARYLKMFTKQAFIDSQKRMQTIFDELTSDNIVYTIGTGGERQSVKISKLGASDLTVLLDPATIKQEIDLLAYEIVNLQEAENPVNLESKKKRQKLLQNYLSILTDSKNQTKAKSKQGGTKFDKRKIGSDTTLVATLDADGKTVLTPEKTSTLEKAFVEYIEFLAEENKAFAEKDKAREVLKKMVDHGELQIRTKMYDKAVEMLANPDVFNEIRERAYSFAKQQFIADRKNIRKKIEDALNQDEVAQVLKDLDEEGIVPDPDEAEDFLVSGDVNTLQSFYTEYGILDPMADADKFVTIERIKNNYIKITEPAVKEEEAIEDVTEESTDNEKAATVINSNLNLNAFAKSILMKRLVVINAQRTVAGNKQLSLEKWQTTTAAKKLASLLADLKYLWISSLNQTQENIQDVIKNEEGFQQWIQDNKANPDVREIVIGLGEPLGISFSMLAKDSDKKELDNKNDKIIDEKGGIRIRKTTVNKEEGYIIEMADGTFIPNSMYVAAGIDPSQIRGSYSTVKKAKDTFRLLLNIIPDTGSFDFAGQTLHYGAVVVAKENNKGKRYISLGTPAKVQPEGALPIIPESDIEKYSSAKQREDAAIKVSAKEFKSKFTVLSESFSDSLVAKDSPKVTVQNILGIYAMPNQSTTADKLSKEDRKVLLNILFKTLSSEEMKDVKLVVSKNPASTSRTKLKDDKTGIENPLVEKTRETHSFRIVLDNPTIVGKVNDAIINKAGIEDVTINDINIQIPSGNTILLDETKTKAINNVFSLPESELKKYFATPKKALLALAKQQVIRKRILDRINSSEAVEISLKDIVDDFNIKLSYSDIYEEYHNITLESLEHNTYDGEQVIIDYSYRIDPVTKTRSRIPTIITNYPVSTTQHKDIRNNVFNELSKKTLANGTTLLDHLKNDRKTDRYHAIIKTPNGNIVFAPLKATALNEESKVKILEKLLDRVNTTTENNLETVNETVKTKDVSYNDKFNDELANDFYISLIQGYDAELKVNARGAIELIIIDKVNDKKLETFYINKEALSKVDSFDKLMSVFGAVLAKGDNTKNLKLKLDGKSFRTNIGQDISAQAISLLTKTNLKPTVFDNVYVDMVINSSDIESYIEGRRAADRIEDKDESVTPAAQSAVEMLSSQLNMEDGVNALSEEEFSALVADNFDSVEKEHMNQIAVKIAQGTQVEDLSEREQQIYKVRGTFIEFKANGLKGQTSVDSDYLAALKERDNAKTELEAYVGELKANVDSGVMTTAQFTMATAGGQDSNYKALKSTLDQKERVVNSFAGKIIPEDFTAKDSESIDKFIAWANENLPDFVTIRNIAEIADRLKANGVPIGAFTMHLNSLSGGVDINGTIYVGDKGYRYHEAFHAVFRLLLSAEEQAEYLAIARTEVRAKLRAEGKNFNEELQKLRNSAEKYQNMSDKSLEREYYEEYMADEFEKFKTNPKSTKTSSLIKSLFNRFVEWIKTVFGKYSKGELQRLFEDIDAGKYKSAGVQNNLFTQGLQTGVVLDAYKILTYDKIELDRGYAEKYLDPDTASTLIRTMTSSYLNRMGSTDPKVLEQNKDKSRAEVLFETIKNYRDLYNPMGEHNTDKTGEQIEKLIKIYTALGGIIGEETSAAETQARDFESKAYDAVTQYISLFDTKINNEQYANEEIEYDEGLRNTSQWDKDQSMIGGFSNVPMALRAFIGTTQVAAQDEFGNTELLNGEVIYIPVDYTSAYNGLLKSVKNTTDPIKVLRSMVSFSQGNTQTQAVVERMFTKLGGPEFTTDFVMKENVETIISAVDNKIFFNELINGFENFRVDYIFIHKNSTRGIEGTKVLLYNASNRDDAANQIDVWKQAHNEKYKSIRNSDIALFEAQDALEQLYEFLNTNKALKKIDADSLVEVSQKASKDIYETTGIKFSPAYIQFSIISNTETRNDYQQSLIDSNKNAEPIELGDLKEIVNQLKLNKERQRTSAYLFTRKGGIKSRLQKLAKNNALFDETIGQSVFLNPEGNFVYAHQMQTLHLKMVSKMNDQSFLEEVKNNNEGYNLTNLLLNSPAFMALSEQERLQVLRVAGTKDGSIGSTNESALSEDGGVVLDKNGKSYGGLTGSEFTASLINVYLSNYQSLKEKNKTIAFVDPITQEEVETALAPVLIRVIEASNTGDMINLPIIKTVELDSKGQAVITDTAVDLFIEEIRREYQRIQREAAKDILDKVPHDGYNAKNGEVSEDFNGRAYKFNDTASLLESVGAAETQVEAKNPKLNEDDALRVLEGTQNTVYLSETAAKVIGLTLKGTSARVVVNSKNNSGEFVIKALGQIKVRESNIKAVVDSLGSAIQKESSKEFNFKVSIGDVDLYVSTKTLQSFLTIKKDGEGGPTKFGYELVKADDFREQINNNLEFNFKSDLESFAVNNTDDSLEQAIESMNDNTMTLEMFKQTIRERLMQEYNRFAQDLDNLDIRTKISSDILNGITDDNGIAKGEAAMQQLNLIRDNQDHNLMQIFFNDWLNTKAINQLILGDQAISLKDGIDKIKRAKMQNASHKSAGTPVYETKLGVNHATDHISFVGFTDEQFQRKYAKGLGDRADAQMYITTKALRHMLFGFAELDARKADLIDRIERNESVSAKELLGTDGFINDGAVFNSLKLVYGDGQTYLKMSAIVLTPELTTKKDGSPKIQYEPLHNLRLRLEKLEQEGDQTIGIAAPVSAIKMMKKNIVSNDRVFSEFNPNEDKLTHSDLRAEFMGLQLVNPSNKLVMTDPTQIKSLITSELTDNVKVYIKSFGKETETTVGEIRSLYHKANKNRLNLKYFDKVNLITNFSLEEAMRELNLSKKKGAITIELKEFLKFAFESLKASQASSNTIEFFNPDKAYDLNNPITIENFEQLFLSFFSKETLSEKVPGHVLALASDSGVKIVRRVYSVDENGNPDRHEVIREKYYNSLDNPPAIQISVDADGRLLGLADAIKKANGKGVVVLDELRHNLKDYDTNGKYTGQRYTEGIMPAHFEQIAEDFDGTNKALPDAIAKAFAVRIPSQDKHSALATKFVDFLPAYYGSTAIFSKELIEISGADFDIDKAYTHIKQWYKNEFGEYVEYGDLSRTDLEQFEDYVHFVSSTGVSSKTVYGKAYEKGSLRLQDYQRFIDEEFQSFDENTGLGKKLFISLKVLGLPTTLEEFVKFRKEKGQPYEAALNNQILDYKYALWSNEGNTISKKEGANPIAYDPAVLDPLLEEWEYIQSELPELAALVQEEGMDVDNLYGKLKAFSNNKEGAASIGAVVLPNLYLNLLGENNIKILSKVVRGQTIRQIEFNGITYNKFNEQFERINAQPSTSVKETEGQRTQFIISALITAMTDNAKERLAAKLGLNKDALSVVATLTKLGVPIRTSILLVNNPIIKEQYFAANNKRFLSDPGIKSRLINVMRDMRKTFKGIQRRSVRVTDEALTSMIKMEKFGENLSELNSDTADLLYSTLKQFVTAHDLKSYLSNLSSVMNLAKGFGRNFTDVNGKIAEIKELGIGLTDEEFARAKYKGMPLPVDLRKMFASDLWQSNMVNVLNHFNEVVLPNVFVTRTKTFNRLNSSILKNLTQNEFVFDEETKNKVSKDLLSYLTIKAYMTSLENKGSQLSLASLNNATIYPQSGSALNINGVVNQLREQFPDNFFLNEFTFNENARELENGSGMHLLQSNTFGKKSDLDKLRVQTAFMELFSESRTEAMHILHYMMVKDGLQYGSGSLLEAITPAILDSFTSSTQDIFGIMRDERVDMFPAKFGMSYSDLLNEFVLGYSLSNKTNVLLHKVINTPFYSQIFEETESLSGKLTTKIAQANPDKLYVFADNAQQIGTIGSSAARGMDNVKALTVMYDLTTFFDNEDLNAVVERIDAEVAEIANSNKAIVFPKLLMDTNQTKKLKKASPVIFEYIDAKLRETFGYSLDEGLLKNAGSISKAAIATKPIAMNLSNNINTLTIDLYKGIKPLRSSDATQVQRLIKGEFNEKQTKKLRRNIQNLEYFNGFKIVSGVIIKRRETKLMEFPAVIKSITGKKVKTVRYFKLKQVYSPFKLNQEIVNSTEGISIGSAAVYEMVDTKGSNWQNPIGFMFDTAGFERPTYKEVRNFVEKLSQEGGFVENALLEDKSQKDILSKAKVMGYDLVYRGNKVFVDLNSFALTGTQENLVSVSELTNEMLEENYRGLTTQDFDQYAPGGTNISEESNDVDTSEAPVVGLGGLFSMLEESNLSEEYPMLTEFWNENIEVNPEALDRLSAQNILTLEDFIAERNDPDLDYKDDETFLDKIKSCIL